MKVDHVYSRWLAVQQPTTVSNKQKALFFGRCPLLSRGLCCESAIYTAAVDAALLVRTSLHDFSLYYFRNFFSTTSTRFVFNPTSGRSRPTQPAALHLLFKSELLCTVSIPIYVYNNIIKL